MDRQFPEFQQMIRDRNEITRAALECAVLVLSLARELPSEHQKPMIVLLKDLISLEEGQGDLPVRVDRSGRPRLFPPPQTLPHLRSPQKEL